MKKPEHYIVVDDDKTNNLICDFTIKGFDPNANVKLFTDPEEALKVIKEVYSMEGSFFPTILFLDVNMPSMTGFEFLDVFQEYDDDIKEQFRIFILTSSIEDFSEEARKYPFVCGFLSKPLKKDNIKNLMKGITGLNGAKQSVSNT